jgi:hypothetical protein
VLAFILPPFDALRIHSAWSTEVPNHGLTRFLGRAPTADLRSALFESALAFASADAAIVSPLAGTDTTIYLPAGPGAFVGQVISGQTLTGGKYIYARARTWIPTEWMREDQTLLPRAQPEDTVALKLWAWADSGTQTPVGATRTWPAFEGGSSCVMPSGRPTLTVISP